MKDVAGCAAVDLGASSGRVILGHVGPDTLELTEINRFRNGPIRLPDGTDRDVLGLYQDILDGLRGAVRQVDVLTGLGIDTWGVDYGLLDADGGLRGNPHSYRDPRSEATIEKVHQQIEPARLYAVNGLQVISINTIYQLAAEPDLQHAHRFLLTPDLLGYWLTGREAAEETTPRPPVSSTPAPAARRRSWSRRWACPPDCCPRSSPRGRSWRRCRPSCARNWGRTRSRSSPRSARTTPRPRSSRARHGPALRGTSPAGRGRSSASSWMHRC